MILCCRERFINSSDVRPSTEMFCVVGDALLVQETISGAVLLFFVFDILFVRETVNQKIFVLDVLLVRGTVDQEIFVFDHQQRFCVRHFGSFERQLTKMFCVVEIRFCSFKKHSTTVTCCDFDGDSICDSWTGLCLGGLRPDLGPEGCWKSAVGASLTAQQSVADRVTEYCRATSAQRPT